MFAFCVIWSIGAPLVGVSQTQFNEFVKKIATSNLPDGMLTDSVYDAESKRWQTWESRVEPYVEPKPFRFYEVIVPTTDSTKFSSGLAEQTRAEKTRTFCRRVRNRKDHNSHGLPRIVG